MKDQVKENLSHQIYVYVKHLDAQDRLEVFEWLIEDIVFKINSLPDDTDDSQLCNN